MSKKVTLLFPGQGSQYVGMGRDLFEDEKSIFERADSALGFSLQKLMLEGPEEKLKLTENTQPAIVTHSIAMLSKLKKILKEKNVEIERCLGHSVGEYSALVAARSLRLEDALTLVRSRGQYMQDAVPVGVGTMYALLKVPEDIAIKACQAASIEGSEVMPANFNDPGQIVVSGHKDAALRAVEWLKENYKEPYRAMELQVSAPFHSRLMRPAATKMKEALFNCSLLPNQVAYVANIDAKEYVAGTPAEKIKENLYRQVEGSVLWTQSIKPLPENTLCLEVGPGRVLTGLLKKIRPDIKTLALDQAGSFDQLEGFFA